MKARPTDLEMMQLGEAAVFDIEATSLKANRGRVICVSVKKVLPDSTKGKTVTIRIDDPRNPHGIFDDRWVIRETIKELNRYQLIVGWYSSRYDFPMLNTRALKHRLLPPQRNFRRDLCFVARGNGNLTNNRLATWGAFLYGKSGKTFLDWDLWDKASRGDRKSTQYIVKHCEADVLETEKLYKSFVPMLGQLRRG